jgi:hypothetical protein
MVYCQPKPDATLLKEIGDSKKVFLLGCSLCANISYCVHNKLQSPIFYKFEGPNNVKAEIKRIKKILEAKDVKTGSDTMMSLCFVTSKQVQQVARKTKEYDTVVTFSCDVGRRNVGDFLKEKIVTGAMKTRGLMRAIVDQHGLTFHFVKDRLYINNKKYSG